MTIRSRRARAFVTVCALILLPLRAPDVIAADITSPEFHPYRAYNTDSWARSVTIGDFNSDGRNDVALSALDRSDWVAPNEIFVFTQGADGSLRSPTVLASDTSPLTFWDDGGLDSGHLNSDGLEDLAVATDDGVEIHYQGRTGKWSRLLVNTDEHIHQVSIVDIDQDSDRDIVATTTKGILVLGQESPSHWSFYRIDGRQAELELGDITHDGLIDIVGIYQKELKVYPQTLEGSFGFPITYRISSEAFPAAGLEVADVSGDGFLDAVVSYGGNQPRAWTKVFYGLAAGVLVGPIDYSSKDIPEPVEAADMNGDDRKDVVTVHGGWDKVGVYVQAATGLLEEERLFDLPYATHYHPKALALGDVTGDGKQDIVLVDYNTGLVVLRQAS